MLVYVINHQHFSLLSSLSLYWAPLGATPLDNIISFALCPAGIIPMCVGLPINLKVVGSINVIIPTLLSGSSCQTSAYPIIKWKWKDKVIH